MARQGNRIRFTRLAIAVLVFAFVITAIGYGFWKRLSTETNPIASDHGPVIVQPSPDDLEKDKTNLRPPHPLDGVLAMARDALKQHQARDRDFTAEMLKQERVGGQLQPETKMFIKLRYENSPVAKSGTAIQERNTSVYLKFLEPKTAAGREAIWCQGKNDDKLVVHETGMLNLVRAELAPRSSLAMLGNRYPITDIGIERLLTKLIERGERDRALGDCIVTLQEHQSIGDRDCRLIEVTHPEPNAVIGGKPVKYEFHIARIYIDTEYMLPLKYAAYGWPETTGGEPTLDESYTYVDLKLNVGLKDSDFDPNNPEYNYPW